MCGKSTQLIEILLPDKIGHLKGRQTKRLINFFFCFVFQFFRIDHNVMDDPPNLIRCDIFRRIIYHEVDAASHAQYIDFKEIRCFLFFKTISLPSIYHNLKRSVFLLHRIKFTQIIEADFRLYPIDSSSMLSVYLLKHKLSGNLLLIFLLLRYALHRLFDTHGTRIKNKRVNRRKPTNRIGQIITIVPKISAVMFHFHRKAFQPRHISNGPHANC